MYWATFRANPFTGLAIEKERKDQGKKTSCAKVLCDYLTVPVFLEVAGTYVTGIEANTIGLQVNLPIVPHSFEDLSCR